MKKIKNKGFTLIELLVVISIIGILATLIISNVGAARLRARDAERKSDLHQIKTSLLLYYNDHDSTFPLTAAFPPLGTEFSDGGNIYMKIVPQDPSYDDSDLTPAVYNYISDDGSDFCLTAVLENLSDGDIATSQSRCDSSCPVPGDGYYFVCPD